MLVFAELVFAEKAGGVAIMGPRHLQTMRFPSCFFGIEEYVVQLSLEFWRRRSLWHFLEALTVSMSVVSRPLQDESQR